MDENTENKTEINEETENKQKKKGRGKKIALIVVCSIAAVLLLYALFVLIANPIFYPEFYAFSEQKESIPDMWSGFTPQGVTVVNGRTLLCGYCSSGASRLYLFENGDGKRIDLEKEDGSVYDGHAGGVTACGDYIYISNASKIFVLKASDVLAAADGSTVRFTGRFEVPSRSSFCSCDGNYLYVGEFHADGYETDESHKVGSAEGEYQALILGYKIDKSAQFGVLTEPEIAYAICDEVQGGAFKDGYAALSCSFGLKSSVIHIYDTTGEPDGSFSYNGASLPLYILDSKREKKNVAAPHMSEDVEFVDGKLLIAFEGGVLKYGGGLLPFAEKHIMLFDIDAQK